MTHTTESRDATLHAETSLRHACSREWGNLRSGFGTTLQTQYLHTKGSGRSLSGARTRPSAVVWGVRVGVGGVGVGGVGGGVGGVGGVGGEGPPPTPMKSNLLVSSGFRSPSTPLSALAAMDRRTFS